MFSVLGALGAVLPLHSDFISDTSCLSGERFALQYRRERPPWEEKHRKPSMRLPEKHLIGVTNVLVPEKSFLYVIIETY